MGCLCAKNEEKDYRDEDTVVKKTYSWDERKKLASDSKNFSIEDKENHEEVRIPGSVNGQQFIIQNCKDSTIYVLDFINTIIVDDCVNCKIILGPISGSAFIRNCNACTFVLACGQFRMRDSVKINVFLYCATQPIIEASRNVHFGSYQLAYDGIEEHFQKAHLSYDDTMCKDVYDFTPVECQENWTFLEHDIVSDFVGQPKLNKVKSQLENLNHRWSNGERINGDAIEYPD